MSITVERYVSFLFPCDTTEASPDSWKISKKEGAGSGEVTPKS